MTLAFLFIRLSTFLCPLTFSGKRLEREGSGGFLGGGKRVGGGVRVSKGGGSGVSAMVAV
jgi:hypothetical protein